MQTRAAKRRCQRADDGSLPTTIPCLVPLLQPVRHALHPLLSAQDAVRFMRASRSITATVLADYAFLDHVFTFRSVSDTRRSLALYARYRMRVVRMCLPQQWYGPLVDRRSGRSRLPASLLALTIGEDSAAQSVAYTALDGRSEQRDSVAELEAEEGKVEEGEREFHRLIRSVNEERAVSYRRSDTSWDVHQWANSRGVFSGSLLPGSLPPSLRALQFSDYFYQPLRQGSIPDTVEVLQFGRNFDQPFAVGVLPASLTHLNFSYCYNQPLLPGVLPAGLRHLYLGMSFNQPIPADTLPPQLQQLSFGFYYNQPILPDTIPSSVTHLRLGDSFSHPLQPGSIPNGVVHLNLGGYFNHPLPAGVLPSSLREVIISRYYNQPLRLGSLPDELSVLMFSPYSDFQHVMQPGVLPASVSVVSMGRHYSGELVAGGIPASVRWLRLPAEYAVQDLKRVLSPSTRVVWWPAPT